MPLGDQIKHIRILIRQVRATPFNVQPREPPWYEPWNHVFIHLAVRNSTARAKISVFPQMELRYRFEETPDPKLVKYVLPDFGFFSSPTIKGDKVNEPANAIVTRNLVGSAEIKPPSKEFLELNESASKRWITSKIDKMLPQVRRQVQFAFANFPGQEAVHVFCICEVYACVMVTKPHPWKRLQFTIEKNFDFRRRKDPNFSTFLMTTSLIMMKL